MNQNLDKIIIVDNNSPYVIAQEPYIYHKTFCDKVIENKCLILVILICLIIFIFYIYRIFYISS